MNERENSEGPIICKPTTFVALAIVFGAVALLALIMLPFRPPEIAARDEPGAIWGFVAMSGLPALCFAVMAWRARIIGDENGLRWRLLRRWKSVAWADVRDFYLIRQSGTQPFYKVEMPIGNFGFSAGTHSNAKALADLIQKRAVNAKAREWGLRGWRDVDVEPQVFRYGDGQNWFFGGLYPLFFGVPLLLLSYAAITGSAGFREWIIVSLQAPLALTLAFVLGAIGGWLGLLACFLFFINWARENWQRRHETVEVTTEGIVWKNAMETIAARWDEITEVHQTKRFLQHRLYWIETVHGGISFSQAISDFGFLFGLLRLRAPHIKIGSSFDKEYTLGGEKLKWSGKRIGEGARIFHYRNRLNRALLWFPTAMFLVSCGCIPLTAYVRPEEEVLDHMQALMWGALVIGICTLLCWLYYFRSSLRVSDEGLEQVHPFGRKFIAWPDVCELKRTESGFHFVRGNDVVIAVRSFLPIDWLELKETIIHRAVNARVNEWTQPEKHLAGSEFA